MALNRLRTEGPSALNRLRPSGLSTLNRLLIPIINYNLEPIGTAGRNPADARLRMRDGQRRRFSVPWLASRLPSPHFSQGDGVPSGDCQNPKLY